jgi:hypothetical protein
MPCFAVKAFELRSGKQCQGARKSLIPTGRSTVPFVVEHGGGRSTSLALSWIRNLIGKPILKIGCAKLALHIGSVVVLWKRHGDYHRGWWPGYTLPW